MVMCDFNSDTSDSWEWADEPRYPEKYSAQGIRIGVNYIIYATDTSSTPRRRIGRQERRRAILIGQTTAW